MGKHFWKGLVIFTGMIVLGLIGVYLVSYFDKAAQTAATTQKVAK